MRPVKPALAGSFIFLLVASGCPRERPASSPRGDDECRHTLLRPERQQLRVWDGASLDEEGRDCFERSHCYVSGERTLVYASAPGTLAIEVGDARYERPFVWRWSARQEHHQAFAHAIAGHDAVALIHPEEVELLTEHGSERFPLPPLLEAERFGPPVLARGGVGLLLGGDRTRPDLPARPFLWLREPSPEGHGTTIPPGASGSPRNDAQGASSGPPGASEGRPLFLNGEAIGRLFRANDGWRVELTNGFTALALPPQPMPPQVEVGAGGAELFVLHERLVRVLGKDGSAFDHSLEEREAVAGAGERLYLLGASLGIERLTPRGREPVMPRAPGADLRGRPLPDGASIERVVASGDERRLAVVERVRFPGCRVEDRLHVLELATGELTTLAEGEGLRLHPRFRRGELLFVEAEPRYEVVAGF